MFGSKIGKIDKLVEKKSTEKLAQLATDKKLDVRLAAIAGLGKCGKDEFAYNALVAAMHDADPKVRRASALALGEMGDVKARAHLDHQSAKEQDAETVAAIQEALKKLHGKED